MKARSVLFYFILFYCLLGKAQLNLVPNFSFEQVDSCPFSPNQLEYASPWFAAYHSMASSDLFDTCNHSSQGIPDNFLGNQLPKTGKSYAGIITYQETNYREYLEVRLQSQLVAGKTYCTTYYVSLAGNSYSSISNMGVKYTQDSLNIASTNSFDLLLNVVPDIEGSLGNYLSDTVGWQVVSGQYTATGNEKFMTIGNFRDDSNSDTIFYSYNQFIGYGAYYYIDDVSVVEVSTASAGTDTTICAGETATIGGIPTFEATYNWYALNGSGNMSIDSATIAKPHVNPIVNTTYVMEKKQCNVTTYDTVVVNVNCVGISEYLYNKNKAAVYPNPNAGVMQTNIHLNYGEKGELQIVDITGKNLSSYSLVEGVNDFTINQSNLESGIYFYRLIVNGIILKFDKIIMIR